MRTKLTPQTPRHRRSGGGLVTTLFNQTLSRNYERIQHALRRPAFGLNKSTAIVVAGIGIAVLVVTLAAGAPLAREIRTHVHQLPTLWRRASGGRCIQALRSIGERARRWPPELVLREAGDSCPRRS